MSQEHRDASLRIIGISAAILGFLLFASVGGAAWMYYAHNHAPGIAPSAGRQTSFHNGPEQRIAILEDYDRVTKQADEHLNGYGWVDRKAGLAHIPIERAMQLTVTGMKPAPAPKVPGQVP